MNDSAVEPMALWFCARKVNIGDKAGPLTISGEGAADFLANIQGLVEFQMQTKRRELMLMDAMPFRQYLDLPPLP